MDIRLIATSDKQDQTGTEWLVGWAFKSLLGFLFWTAVIAAVRFIFSLV